MDFGLVILANAARGSSDYQHHMPYRMGEVTCETMSYSWRLHLAPKLNCFVGFVLELIQLHPSTNIKRISGALGTGY